MKMVKISEYYKMYDKLHSQSEMAYKCLSKKGYTPSAVKRFTEGTASDLTFNYELTKAQKKYLKDLDKCHKGYGGASPKRPKAEQLTLFGVRKRHRRKQRISGCSC